MAAFVLVVAVIAFLAGVITAGFLMLFIGIRKGDRPERILGARNSPLDSSVRRALSSGSWPNVPVYRVGREDD